MQSGVSEVHEIPTRFLVAGLSYQHLFFIPAGSGNKK